MAGGICITRGVRDQLRDRSDYEFEDLGEHLVKNIARPVRVFRLVFDPLLIKHLGLSDRALDGTNTGIPIELLPASQDAAELLFWQTIQDSNAPDEYSAYLTKFPEGIFSELARSRLNNPKQMGVVATMDALEITFWNSVERSEDATMYQSYMQKYPKGNFRALAEIWLSTHTSLANFTSAN